MEDLKRKIKLLEEDLDSSENRLEEADSKLKDALAQLDIHDRFVCNLFSKSVLCRGIVLG